MTQQNPFEPRDGVEWMDETSFNRLFIENFIFFLNEMETILIENSFLS